MTATGSGAWLSLSGNPIEPLHGKNSVVAQPTLVVPLIGIAPRRLR